MAAQADHARPSSPQGGDVLVSLSYAQLARRPKDRGIARGSSLHCRSLRLTMDRRAMGAPACFVCDLAAEKRESVLGR